MKRENFKEMVITSKRVREIEPENWTNFLTEEDFQFYNLIKDKPTFKLTAINGRDGNSNRI